MLYFLYQLKCHFKQPRQECTLSGPRWPWDFQKCQSWSVFGPVPLSRGKCFISLSVGISFGALQAITHSRRISPGSGKEKVWLVSAKVGKRMGNWQVENWTRVESEWRGDGWGWGSFQALLEKNLAPSVLEKESLRNIRNFLPAGKYLEMNL